MAEYKRQAGVAVTLGVILATFVGILAITSAPVNVTTTSSQSSSNGTQTTGQLGTSSQSSSNGTQSTGQLGSWNRTSSYPFAPGNLSCVVNGQFVYCVGGYNGTSTTNITESNNTFYASLSPTGIGRWIRTTDYPLAIGDETCVASSNYIYCVGGFNGSGIGGAITGQDVPDVFYAPLSPSGIGSWKQATAYPYPVEFPQCMSSSSYIYCVTNRFNGTTNIPGLYFASLSTAGVGNWEASSQPPFSPNGCSASGGYVYCDGGESCSPQPPPFSCPSPVYFAPLSPGGVGAWTRTTDLPTAVQGFFVTAGAYGYFFGGPVYYIAHLSSNGTGSWTTSTPYPQNSPMTCVTNGDYFYCIGTSTVDFYPSSNVYFARIGVESTAAKTTNSSTSGGSKISSNTVVATVTVTETLTSLDPNATTTYAPPSGCAVLPITITTTTTATIWPTPPASTTTTTMTTTSTSYTQTVTVTSCTTTESTVTSTVTTTATP